MKDERVYSRAIPSSFSLFFALASNDLLCSPGQRVLARRASHKSHNCVADNDD